MVMQVFVLILIFCFINLSVYAGVNPCLIFFKNEKSIAEQKIIESAEFSKKIQDKAQIITIDCTQFSKEEMQNLKDKYHFNEIPRLILVDQNDQEMMRFAFKGEKPETLAERILHTIQQVKDLEKAAQSLTELNLPESALEELYKSASILKRNHEASIFLEKGVEKNGLFFLLEKYRFCLNTDEGKAYREKIVALDPQNQKDALLTLALIDFQHLASQCPSKNAIKPLEDYLLHFGENDEKNRWRLEMMIAQFYLNYDEWNTSLKHAEVALQKAPSDIKNEISKCCEYIKSQATTHLAECTR